MRCAACDAMLGVYTKGDLCGECVTIVRQTVDNVFVEVKQDDVREMLECVQINNSIGYQQGRCGESSKD